MASKLIFSIQNIENVSNKDLLYKFIFGNSDPIEYVEGTVYPENTIVYIVEGGDTTLYKVNADGGLDPFGFDGTGAGLSGLTQTTKTNNNMNILI